MIFQYTFPFGVSELQIKSSSQFNKKILERLSFLIETFQIELNSRIINSSGYRLNHSQIGIPAFVKSEFITYLKYCLTIEDPKVLLQLFTTKDNVYDNLYLISQKDSAVIRQKEVTFNSNLLSRYFILEKINEFLSKEGSFNYLIITNQIQSSHGKLRWKANFFISELNEFIHFKLHNEQAIMETFPSARAAVKSTKFASIDKFILPKYLIMIGGNLIKLKLLVNTIKNLNYKYDFESLCKKELIKIIIVTYENEVLNFE